MKCAIAFCAVVALALQSCSTTERAKPSDAIRQAYAALNSKDTSAYFTTLSSGARDIYRAAPKRIGADLAYWNANRFAVEILSESADADDAVVTYRMKVTGANPEEGTMSVVVYREGGSWRISTPSMYSAYERIPPPPQPPHKPGESC
jgi:hypothetical protein